MGKVLKYSLKMYAVLTTLILQNGVLYLQGSKQKFNKAVEHIKKLKEDGVISYSEMGIVYEPTRWEKFYEIHLKDFKYKNFIVMDILSGYVILKVDT